MKGGVCTSLFQRSCQSYIKQIEISQHCLWKYNSWYGRSTHQHQRTKDPNNHSDNETGTLFSEILHHWWGISVFKQVQIEHRISDIIDGCHYFWYICQICVDITIFWYACQMYVTIYVNMSRWGVQVFKRVQHPHGTLLQAPTTSENAAKKGEPASSFVKLPTNPS